MRSASIEHLIALCPRCIPCPVTPKNGTLQILESRPEIALMFQFAAPSENMQLHLFLFGPLPLTESLIILTNSYVAPFLRANYIDEEKKNPRSHY